MQIICLLVLALFHHVSTDVKTRDCDYGLSPCEAYASADAVFIGKVTNIDPATFTQRQWEQGYDQTVYIDIEKVYKGYKRRQIVLKQLARKGAETFVYGARYLFYANYDRSGRHWEVEPCGRTRMASYVQDDLGYLDKLPTYARRTRVAGEIVHSYIDPDIGRTMERLSGIRVKIVGGEKEYEAATDEKGIYEVYDLPPGKYSIEPRLPKGLEFHMAIHYGPNARSRVRTLEIELAEGGCSGVTIILASVKEPIGIMQDRQVRPQRPEISIGKRPTRRWAGAAEANSEWFHEGGAAARSAWSLGRLAPAPEGRDERALLPAQKVEQAGLPSQAPNSVRLIH